MNAAELEAKVRRILADITADTEALNVKADVRIRDQLDLDSMDFLNFLIAVDEALGVDIPEADYPKLRTLNDIVAYLTPQVA
jgi:acyl carrier protein